MDFTSKIRERLGQKEIELCQAEAIIASLDSRVIALENENIELKRKLAEGAIIGGEQDNSLEHEAESSHSAVV